MDKKPVKINVEGKIDYENAAAFKESILQKIAGQDDVQVELDMAGVFFISSAGLRALLQINNSVQKLTLTSVNPDINEIFQITGLTELISVRKEYRTISVEGCKLIGEGFNGKIYKIDPEKVVKVYKDPSALDEILHEREMARLAMILGVPTAISYEVVRAGDSYGAVFELLDAKTFSSILAESPEQTDWCVREYTDLLKKVHGTVVPEGRLPSANKLVRKWIRGIQDCLPRDSFEKLDRMIEAVPERGTMLHGDCHTNNVVLAGDEVLLIDMDTLAVGHPIFELAQMYGTFVGFGESNPDVIQGFLGISASAAGEFWKRSLRRYLDTDEDRVSAVEQKIRCVAYTRLIDWSRRHRDPDDAASRTERELWIRELTELIDEVDSLGFDVSG